MVYAEQYYLRYPKVAIGHWPPAFYIAQAAWTLGLGPSRVSVLLLQALLAALTAAVIYNAAMRHGHAVAAVAGAIFLLLHVTRRYTAMVMAENLLALVSICAALALGAYLETEKPWHSVLFAMFAALAVLTKGTGWALALVCLSRSFSPEN
jgi:4-amino-4-deoxy-L-arabinose transferase-like glycosyltransferase